MNDAHSLPFGFDEVLKKNSDEVLKAVNVEEGVNLTKVLLSYDGVYPDDKTAPLTDKGLARINKDGKLEVTKYGMKAVSYFPLLGRKGQKRPYPEAFFPFLLSIIASSVLQSGRWQKLIASDFFTPLFPGIEKERITEAAIKAMERLIEIGVADDSESELRLSKEKAQSFMRLKEEERLAIILREGAESNREQRERTALFIHLSFSLSGINEDEREKTLDIIKELSGTEVSLDELLLFSIVDENDGILSGRELPLVRGTLAVSSDFSITYTGKSPEDIYLFASPIMTDTTTEWKITKSAMKAAFSLGMNPENVKSILTGISSFPLPETLYPRISGWYSSFSSLKAERVLVLKADERNARIIDALPTIKVHVAGKLDENIFLMNIETEALWRRALENAGFDMLGPTTGPHFDIQKKDEKSIPQSSFTAPKLGYEREIPYTPEMMAKQMESTDDPIRKALINSGFIVSEEESTPSVDTVNGLYYQEKMRIVHTALNEGMKLYAEFADGSVLVGKPSKADDEKILILDHEVDPAKIWKAAVFPKSVRDFELPPSDNDNL